VARFALRIEGQALVEIVHVVHTVHETALTGSERE
jgi:hypothetical protein